MTPSGSRQPLEVAAVLPEPAVMQAVVAGGAGIARLPDFLAAAAIARGELIRVLPDHLRDAVEFHALYPSRHTIVSKVRAFTDALIAHVHAEQQTWTTKKRV